jgi:hypothetical protein
MSDPESSEPQLSAPDRELLARALRQRGEEGTPASVRERLLARALEEAQRGRSSLIVAGAQLVPVRRRPFGAAVWLSGAAMLALVFWGGARGLWQGAVEPPPLSAELNGPAAHSPGSHSPARGLLNAPLFRKPAQLLPESSLPAGALPPALPSLFAEAPFSAQSGLWQVRRWNNLSADPVEPAAHQVSNGALCVPLAGGERVLGGWPWAPPGAVVPKGVALAAGKTYRLVFKAWAEEPLPAQLLVAVGHSRLPFSAAGGARVPVTTTPQSFAVEVLSTSGDPSAGLAFLATAGDEPTRVCLSDVKLAPQ